MKHSLAQTPLNTDETSVKRDAYALKVQKLASIKTQKRIARDTNAKLSARQPPLTGNLKVCKFSEPVRTALGGMSPTAAAIALQLFKHGELNYSRDSHGYDPTYHSPLSTYRKVISAVDELEASGFLINNKQRRGSRRTTRSVINATDLLFDVVGNTIQACNPITDHPLDIETMREQIQTPDPLHLVVLRDSKKI